MASELRDLIQLISPSRKRTGIVLKISDGRVSIKTSKGILIVALGSVPVSVGDRVYTEEGTIIGTTRSLDGILTYVV